jgi:hypothetical protein
MTEQHRTDLLEVIVTGVIGDPQRDAEVHVQVERAGVHHTLIVNPEQGYPPALYQRGSTVLLRPGTSGGYRIADAIASQESTIVQEQLVL